MTLFFVIYFVVTYFVVTFFAVLAALLLLALLGFDRLGQGSTRFVAAHPVLRALSSCYTTWISQFLSSLFLAALFLPPYFYRLIFTALFSPSYFYSLTFTVFSAVLWCVFDQGCNDDHRPQPLTHPTRSSKGPPLKQIILVMYTVCIKKQLLARAMTGRPIRQRSAKASAPGLYCKDLVG
jgi:hypothetical protein